MTIILSSASKKSSRPSTASSVKPPQQQPAVPKSAPSSELLSLRLENSELTSRLDALSNTDESKSELLKLLEEQTSQTNLLQSKCDELHRGFLQIDKERRALRKSADDARNEALRRVGDMRGECEAKCEQLQKQLQMREKEVEKLAERTREQERRIEAAAGESNDRQLKVRYCVLLLYDVSIKSLSNININYGVPIPFGSKMDELEGELEELIGMVENERENKKALGGEYAKVIESVKEKEDELREARLESDSLERQVREGQQKLEAEEGRWKTKEDQLNKTVQSKEDEVASLVQDQQLSKIEQEQAIQTLQDELEAQRADFASQQHNMAEAYQGEKEELVNSLQSKINDKSSTISNLTSQIDTLQTNHAAKVVELEDSIQECKEKTQAVEMTYQESLATNSHLQEELNELRSSHQNQLERMAIDHEEELANKSEQVAAMERELHEENSVSNKLRSQLRELNIQLKEDGSTRRKEKDALERELENAREDVSMKENEVKDLHGRLQAESEDHAAELESLRTEHAAQIMVIETRGADVVSDLEDVIAGLEKEATADKLGLEQVVSKLQTETANMERSLAESEMKCSEQERKITSLTEYAKERKDDVNVVKAELLSVKHTLEIATREREDAVSAVQNELHDARVLHEREMSSLQHIVDNVRSELITVEERIAFKDGEMERVKSTLSERTNLLKDMVNQTTAYQGDYEKEHARANQLDEAVKSYKKQLADVRDMAQALENEIIDKDGQYCEAMRNERQHRKAVEEDLESSRKTMEVALRKSAEMGKEVTALKDKVFRQEKYIGRLQDREKQSRRATMGRPSTAGTRSPGRSKDRLPTWRNDGQYSVNENDMPNTAGRY